MGVSTFVFLTKSLTRPIFGFIKFLRVLKVSSVADVWSMV